MLQAIKQLFRLGRPAPASPPSSPGFYTSGMPHDLEDEDIPRYPPFAKGLPVAPIDKIMQTQRILIEKIKQALGLPQAEFDRLVYPVLLRYAMFVHLLPASEAHHHRGAGGLFRHGLEVAFWASQASNAIIFSIEGSPLERRNNEPRWRLASCFAGLLHDVGKPLSDTMVSDRDGRMTWNPYGESLFDWAGRHKIDRYFLRWRDSRHKRHEKFSLLTVDRLIPQVTREYLSDGGPQVIESMLEAISGMGANQPITRLVLRADRESVARDMKGHRLNVDEFSYGIAVERYIFDALRRLVRSGKWKINVAGGKVWVLQQGVFVIWKPVQDIIDLLAQDKTPGVPRDPDTLADILIERGFAHSCAVSENGEKAQYRYWRVLPDALKAHGITEHLLMLRLDSVDLIVTGEPPVPLTGDVVGLQELPEDQEEKTGAQSEVPLKKSAPADLVATALGAMEPKSLPVPSKSELKAKTGQASATAAKSATTPKKSTGAANAATANNGADQTSVLSQEDTTEVDDEVASALEAERAASVALGGLGLDGIEMFAPIENADAGSSNATPSNAVEANEDGLVLGRPGQVAGNKNENEASAAVEVGSADTARGHADAMPDLPVLGERQDSSSSTGEVDLGRPGAGKPRDSADDLNSDMELLGMPRKRKAPAFEPGESAKTGVRKKVKEARAEVSKEDSAKAPYKAKKKAKASEPFRPGAEPVLEANTPDPVSELAPAPAPAPAPARVPEPEALVIDALEHSTISPDGSVAEQAGGAAANASSGQSSALLELMSLGFGLGVGEHAPIEFVQLHLPDEAPVDVRGDSSERGVTSKVSRVGRGNSSRSRTSAMDQPGVNRGQGKVSEPSLSVAPETDAPAPAAPAVPVPQDARQALREGLRAYGGQVLRLLGRVIAPILDRRSVLGDALYFQDNRLCIVYPEGAEIIAGEESIQDVISELQNTGAIVLTKSIPERSIWNFDGVKALVLNEDISSLARSAFDELARKLESAEFLPEQVTSTPECRREYQAPMVDMQRREKNRQQLQMNSAEVTSSVVPEPLKLVEDELVAKGFEEKPVRSLIDSEKEHDGPVDTVGSIPYIARQLRQMIINGEGRWLASSVSEDECGRYVDVRSFDLIKSDFPLLKIATFKFTADKYGLKIIKKRIYVKDDKK